MKDGQIKVKNEFRKEERAGVKCPNWGYTVQTRDSLGDQVQMHAPAIVISRSAEFFSCFGLCVS